SFRRGGASAGRALGDHPEGGAVTVRAGRFGPYVNHGSVNANLPRGSNPDDLTLEQALPLLAARAAAAPSKGKAKAKAAPKAKARRSTLPLSASATSRRAT